MARGGREGQRRRLLADAPSAAPSPSASAAPSPSASAADRQAEALLSLRKAIDKKGTSLDSWGREASSSCAWFGVRCGDDGAVSSVELPGALLEGSLPRDKAIWAALPRLQTLDLSSNRLGGAVPAELAACAELEQLNLLGNRLTGSLPAALPSSLPKLETLILARNGLGGSLPSEWGAARSLRVLDVSANEIGGRLPESWGGLDSLRLLNVSANRLSGPIPGSWRPEPDGVKGMAQLREAYFGGNPGLCSSLSDNGKGPSPNFVRPAIFNGPCSTPFEIAAQAPGLSVRPPRLIENQGTAAGTDPNNLKEESKSSERATTDAMASSIVTTIVKPPHCTSRRVESIRMFGWSLVSSASWRKTSGSALRSTWIRYRWDEWCSARSRREAMTAPDDRETPMK